jgi:hypothetical protein
MSGDLQAFLALEFCDVCEMQELWRTNDDGPIEIGLY